MKSNERIKHYIVALTAIIVGVIIDQITKFYAVAHLKEQKPFIILKGIFQLEYLENRGAAFGMLQNQQLLFLICVLFITIFLVYFYMKVPMDKKFLPLRICAIMILAGAYGNFIDRLRLGYVVDFFYFILIDFPIFNVADIYVTVAAVLLVLLIIFYYKEEDLDRVFHN